MPAEKVLAASNPRNATSLAAQALHLNGWPPPETLADPPPHSYLKMALASAMYRSGALRVAELLAGTMQIRRRRSSGKPAGFGKATVPRFAVLCYHRVGRGGAPVFSGLPTKTFEAQMKYLRKHYQIVSLDTMLREMTDPRDRRPAVAVTFDDGYVDLFSQAFPVLQRYEIPATIYLTAGAIESGELAWYDKVFVAFQVAPGSALEVPLAQPRQFKLGSPAARLNSAVEYISLLRKLPSQEARTSVGKLELAVPLPGTSLAHRMLDWDQIRQMQSGGISFGAHTMSHPVVSRLSEAELSYELLESKQLLERRLATPVFDFAFPFGKEDECSEISRSYLAKAGYRSAATTIEGLNDSSISPFSLRRVSFCEERSLAMFAFRLTQLFLSQNEDSLQAKPDSGTAPDRVDKSGQKPAAARQVDA